MKIFKTGTIWNIFGKSTSGPMEGARLETMPYGDYFAWLVFYPDTKIYE